MYIQFWAEVCIGGSGVGWGGEGGGVGEGAVESGWEVVVLPVIFIAPG